MGVYRMFTESLKGVEGSRVQGVFNTFSRHEIVPGGILISLGNSLHSPSFQERRRVNPLTANAFPCSPRWSAQWKRKP